jgi:hypothetical protein
MRKTYVSLILAISAVLTVSNVGHPAVFIVNTTVDAGPGSLRDAINLANAMPGNDQIFFSIMPPGAYTIVPLSPLPPLLDPAGVTIDGITQPGGADCGPNPPQSAVLLIEISGFAAGPTPGLWVLSGANWIQGLVINQFQQDGILIEAGVANPTVFNNVIRCCFIGTDLAGGADLGNGTNLLTLYGGVRIKNVAGGIANFNSVDRCLISGNYAEGVAVWGPIQPGDVGSNSIVSNFIGTDRSGTIDLGNDHEGVCLTEGTHDNVVIANLISGNDYEGVGIQGFNNIPFGPPILSYSNRILNNFIGLDFNLAPLPNQWHGVAIGTYGPTFWGCAYHNFIEGNVIAENGMDGIYIWEDPVDNTNGDENLLSKNSIYNNGGLGIDLHTDGVTTNDPGDPDLLANEEMNYPIIDSAKIVGTMTTIYGYLDTPSPANARLEVFMAKPDPSGHGEGAAFVDTGYTDPFGNFIISTSPVLNSNDTITLTACDNSNNTSEFSKIAVVTCCLGNRGDVNNDGTDANILDLTYTVDRIFRGGPPAVCPPEGDVNSDGTPTNILDLTYLVDRIFRGGPPPGIC